MIEIRNLDISRGGVRVFSGLSAVCKAGQITAVIGPNGSGKSSLLLAMMSELKPDGGEIVISDGAKISFAPQHQEFLSPLVVSDVLAMSKRVGATPASLTRAIAVTDISSLQNKKVTELSGGQAARVSLALALAQESTHILLDEPFASIDLSHRNAIVQELRARADAGATIIVVAHAQKNELAWCDQIIDDFM